MYNNPKQPAARPWSTGICHSCFSDCLLSCAVSGTIYALIMHFTGCGCCCYSSLYRSKMRRRYTLLEEPCTDCLVHCCCHKCALRQEYRELQHQGFDMSLGKIHFFPSS
ncbi:hypothetical protein RJ639_013035 [Escallonia herrerae]|uniref:PLAC8 motif-containing protein n=1 Tax=Escallonia herrerae TaxID=1293975 RepID=A0AA88VQ81_9ASTE|nr:hypothetical protein RJ639_013035 [Escallonia herrerae]